VSTSQGRTWAEPIYLDASALVKLFVPEPESEALNQALVGAKDVIVSDLALTEMASALGRRAREGRLTLTESRRLYREAEKLTTSCRPAELTPSIHRRAERILLLSQKVPLRALDALHLATALDAEAVTIVTYDPRLRDAAAAHGLFAAPEGLPQGSEADPPAR
jgi:predicted nucleic acid-binding protein